MTEFEKDLAKVINKHSMENVADVPDFILAAYLMRCLEAFNIAHLRTSQWYGHHEHIMDDFQGNDPEKVLSSEQYQMVQAEVARGA